MSTSSDARDKKARTVCTSLEARLTLLGSEFLKKKPYSRCYDERNATLISFELLSLCYANYKFNLEKRKKLVNMTNFGQNSILSRFKQANSFKALYNTP